MRRILIATDLSARSDRVLDRAAALSNEWNAELLVLHVVDEELPAGLADRAELDAEAAIDDQLNAGTTSGNHRHSRKVVLGSAVREIIAQSEAFDADLVEMGTHREAYEGLGELFLGTTVERVIRHGRRPVLVAKMASKRPYRRVLVGVDFSAYSRRAVEFATRIVPGGDVILVHGYEVPFRSLFLGRSPADESAKVEQDQVDTLIHEEMQAFLGAFSQLPSGLRHLMYEGSPSQVIRQQVKTQRADLLVVGTHGRTGVAEVKRLSGDALAGLVGDELVCRSIAANLAVMAGLRAEIAELERLALQRARPAPAFAPLLSVSGVGRILALTIMLETGDIGRFAGPGNFASYCRCVASTRISNARKKGEGNRRCGNRHLAWAFVEAGHFAVRFEPRAKRYYERKKARRNAIVARKAVAHKLARASYHVMRDQVSFSAERCFG